MNLALAIASDSSLVKQELAALLHRHAGVRVQQSVRCWPNAVNKLAEPWPDVLLVDVEGPNDSALELILTIMALHPLPIVVLHAEHPAQIESMRAYKQAGAVDGIFRPNGQLRAYFAEHGREIVDFIFRRAAIQALATRPQRSCTARLPGEDLDHVLQLPAAKARFIPSERIVALGASTGGTLALEHVLGHLSPSSPGLVVVQHMPKNFTAAFAQRLNGLCTIDVSEAKHGDTVRRGSALIAPGGRHMMIVRQGSTYVVELVDGPPVNRHRPSVDVLFRSVAIAAGANAVGVIMTGMGNDGAYGLKELRDAGGHTIAQDEQSSAVFGMPKAAIKLGAAREIASLNAIAGLIAR